MNRPRTVPKANPEDVVVGYVARLEYFRPTRSGRLDRKAKGTIYFHDFRKMPLAFWDKRSGSLVLEGVKVRPID